MTKDVPGKEQPGFRRSRPAPEPAAHQRQPTSDSGGRPVCVIDDDTSIREALAELLRSVGFSVKEYASAQDALKSDAPTAVDCFIVDIRMPGLSGLDFQHHLRALGIPTPIIFMTGHADIPMTVQAMKAGAHDFMTKPFRDQDMLDAVSAAVALNRMRQKDELNIKQTLSRFDTLSVREREVMTLLAAGLMNKQAAARINVAIPTVKRHRAHIMKKMGAKSFAELVRMAALLQLGPSAKARALDFVGHEKPALGPFFGALEA